VRTDDHKWVQHQVVDELGDVECENTRLKKQFDPSRVLRICLTVNFVRLLYHRIHVFDASGRRFSQYPVAAKLVFQQGEEVCNSFLAEHIAIVEKRRNPEVSEARISKQRDEVTRAATDSRTAS